MGAGKRRLRYIRARGICMSLTTLVMIVLVLAVLTVRQRAHAQHASTILVGDMHEAHMEQEMARTF